MLVLIIEFELSELFELANFTDNSNSYFLYKLVNSFALKCDKAIAEMRYSSIANRID
ncbi:hypothetical protein GCM10007162_04150 [Ignatzschineria ureiclastica]|nr:hypothetical protein GCM10007162_04150 [Ignatzschineria ureiclastica]